MSTTSGRKGLNMTTLITIENPAHSKAITLASEQHQIHDGSWIEGPITLVHPGESKTLQVHQIARLIITQNAIGDVLESVVSQERRDLSQPHAAA
jgi:hypothetical protein